MDNNPSYSEHNTSDFVRLLTNNQTALRGYITSLLPGNSDILDIMQETNITLWDKKDSFKTGSNFTAWAYTIAKFKVLQYHAKRKKNQHLVFSSDILESIASLNTSSTPKLEEQQLNALQRCISKLKNTEQEHIKARYNSNSEFDIYADQIGRSKASLRVSLHRIRKKLRICISKHSTAGGSL